MNNEEDPLAEYAKDFNEAGERAVSAAAQENLAYIVDYTDEHLNAFIDKGWRREDAVQAALQLHRGIVQAVFGGTAPVYVINAPNAG